MAVAYVLQAQRHDGTAWRDICAKFNGNPSAYYWAVLKVTRSSRGGKVYTTRQVLGRYKSRPKAVEHCDAMVRAQVRVKPYRLGRRMAPKSATV